MLSSLDIPLASVAALLRTPGPELRALLSEQRRRLAREGDLLPCPIALRVEPTQVTATTSGSTEVECMLHDGSMRPATFSADRRASASTLHG